MQEVQLAPLATWQTFYILIGTAAATLTGLMFIVVTLLAGLRERVPLSSEVFATFNTPNVVHFGLVLLVAAIRSAPWQALWPAGVLLGLCGLGGNLRRHRAPACAPAVRLSTGAGRLAVSYCLAAGLLRRPRHRRGNLLLLFVGIHNAWDNVTFIAIDLSQRENTRQEK
jgi:hypothetical protein